MPATASRAQITTPTEREIHIERVFDASRDRVWRAYTDPKLIAQWWGRGNKLDIERHDFVRGGHWRYVEYSDGKTDGFEGRYREITPKDRIVQTFEWDGMPGYVIIETVVFEDLGDARTKVSSTSLFHTTEERDGFLASGVEGGLNDAYAALDRLLATMT